MAATKRAGSQFYTGLRRDRRGCIMTVGLAIPEALRNANHISPSDFGVVGPAMRTDPSFCRCFHKRLAKAFEVFHRDRDVTCDSGTPNFRGVNGTGGV